MSVLTSLVDTQTPTQRKTQDLIRTVLVTIAVTLAVAAVLWLIWTLSTLLIVLILSGFLAYVFSPLGDLFCRSFALFGRRRCLPRGWAILGALSVVGLAL